MTSIRKITAIALLATAAAVSVPAHAVPAGQGAAGHGHEYRTFYAGGATARGKIDDSYTADLVMYLAGNQCLVMEALITDFQTKYPEVRSVYVQTTPAGKIVKQQILAQGEINGTRTARNPDLFASINLGHLQKLRQEGLMQSYMVYAHNKLELMVAEGNPKRVRGPQDLARDDLAQSHPNPLTEAIFRVYGSQMLRDLGLYEAVTGGQTCRRCWAVPGKTWFTAHHQGEIPARIEQGTADVGIVWSSEVLHAHAEGRRVEGVAIPAPYNMAHKVNYAIGQVASGRNSASAHKFLRYLATDAAQAIYAQHGFEKALPEELISKPIPATIARR
ncbi:MAG: substrate-binding domain-containing protein [Pseudomonadota bacterium]|nr:MAG: substrate-binding domain-containing protein [Pseudomonadota bacterium]